MKKPLLDTFNRIGGKRLNEAHAWEREEGKPLPTLADVTAAHEANSLQEDDTNASELPEAWIEANKDEYEDVIDGIIDAAWEKLSDIGFGPWAEDSGYEWPSDEEEEYLKNKIMKRVLKELV